MKTKLHLFPMRVAMMLLVALCAHLSAWAQSVSTITTSENIARESTVYAGEVVADGVTVVKYLYSKNVSVNSEVIKNLQDALNGMADNAFATLLSGKEFDYSAESKGIAVCSDATLTSAMDANWSSARYVGTLCLPEKSFKSETTANLYELDEGFKGAVDAQTAARAKEIEKLANAENSIVSHLDSRTITDVYYTIEDGRVVRHSDTYVIYDSEATKVIYTKVELESAVPTKELSFTIAYGMTDTDFAKVLAEDPQLGNAFQALLVTGALTREVSGEKVVYKNGDQPLFYMCDPWEASNAVEFQIGVYEDATTFTYEFTDADRQKMKEADASEGGTLAQALSDVKSVTVDFIAPEVPKGIAINEENFPDPIFREYLLAHDYGADAVLTDEEIASIKEISLREKNVASLKGVEYFTELENLEAVQTQLTSIDVSKNTKLVFLNVAHGQLTELDLSHNLLIKTLGCKNNQLTKLDVSNLTELGVLEVSDNQISKIDVSNNTNLGTFYCEGNQLTSIDVSKCPELQNLYCYGNKIDEKAMGELVAGLADRKRWVTEGTFVVVDTRNPNEQNVINTLQVAAAKAKNWRVYDLNDYEPVDYAGVETTGITTPSALDSHPSSYYTLSGQRLSKPRKGINIIGGKKVMVK